MDEVKKGKGVLLDVEGEGGEVHQICNFIGADNFWIISHSKKHLEQMLKRPHCRSGEGGFGAQASESVVDKHHALLKRRRT